MSTPAGRRTHSSNASQVAPTRVVAVPTNPSRGSARSNNQRGQGCQTALLPVSISSADLATYREVQAQLDAQKKAAQEAEDAAIRARNQELLEGDDDVHSDTEQPGPARKKARTTAPRILSDDEEEMAAGLASIRAVAQGNPHLHQEQDQEQDQEARNEDLDEEDAAQGSRGEDEEDPDLLADLEGIDVNKVDVDMDLASGGEGLSNEMGVNVPADLRVAAAPPQGRSKPKTPSSKTQATATASLNTSKVVEKDFSPRTLRLALAVTSHIRSRTVFEEPFPRNNKISRINFAWKTIQQSASASTDQDLRQAYKRATKDTVTKIKLTKFALYGRTGLISSIISKARDKVRAFYGFTGDPDSVKKDVEWLLKDSHFVYGGINLKEHTVDQMKPFGCQLIVDIIEAQWFPSTSRSKLDLETTNKIYERRDLPLNVLLLSVTSIEHALKEWTANGRKACQITFSEETAKQSYEHHLGHWKFFEKQMKAWPAWFKRTTLAQILANHSNFDLNADENNFAGLDFAALDGLAGYEEADQQQDVEAPVGLFERSAEEQEVAAGAGIGGMEASTSVAEVSQV